MLLLNMGDARTINDMVGFVNGILNSNTVDTLNGITFYYKSFPINCVTTEGEVTKTHTFCGKTVILDEAKIGLGFDALKIDNDRDSCNYYMILTGAIINIFYTFDKDGKYYLSRIGILRLYENQPTITHCYNLLSTFMFNYDYNDNNFRYKYMVGNSIHGFGKTIYIDNRDNELIEAYTNRSINSVLESTRFDDIYFVKLSMLHKYAQSKKIMPGFVFTGTQLRFGNNPVYDYKSEINRINPATCYINVSVSELDTDADTNSTVNPRELKYDYFISNQHNLCMKYINDKLTNVYFIKFHSHTIYYDQLSLLVQTCSTGDNNWHHHDEPAGYIDKIVYTVDDVVETDTDKPNKMDILFGRTMNDLSLFV